MLSTSCTGKVRGRRSKPESCGSALAQETDRLPRIASRQAIRWSCTLLFWSSPKVCSFRRNGQSGRGIRSARSSAYHSGRPSRGGCLCVVRDTRRGIARWCLYLIVPHRSECGNRDLRHSCHRLFRGRQKADEEVCLGGGPVFTRGCSINTTVFADLRQNARELGLDCPIQGASKSSKTDADAAFRMGAGAPTARVSISVSANDHHRVGLLAIVDRRILARHARHLASEAWHTGQR